MSQNSLLPNREPELEKEAGQVGSESSLSLPWRRPGTQLHPGKLCPFSALRRLPGYPDASRIVAY